MISPKMPAGQFAVGGFGQGCIYFERQIVTVEISYEDEINFQLNLATLRAESRGVLAIPTPQAIVVGSFSSTMAWQAKTTTTAPHTAPAATSGTRK